MQIKQRQDIWKAGIVFGIALFILNSAIFVWLGRVNADEGWYLYASKLVYAGYLPYKDFAFTQTPLLPYIYGIPQLFFQSLYLGRITSVVFSTATFLLSLRIAENYGGKMATAIAALLGATFSNGIYAQATTTTFALTSFFLMAAFFVLSSNLRQNHKAVLAVVFVIMATLSRLSAAFFAIPFVVYAFMIADKKGRLIILGLCLATLAGMLLLISANIDGAIWGLVGYHTGQWGDKSLLERAATIAGLRIPALLLGYSYYFLLWATVFFLGLSRIRARIKEYPVIVITTLGLLLFAIPNLTSGGFYIDYFVPFIFTSFPITAIVFAKIFPHEGARGKLFMNAVLTITMMLGMVLGGFYFIDTSGQRAPIEEIRDVSAVIAKNTTSKDKIFALQALWVAIEAHREALPNTTMAQFSFDETDTPTANRLHVVNGEITLDDFENRVPKIVALTELDWSILKTTAEYPQIVKALERNYSLLLSEDDFGYDSSRIEIYIARGK